MERRWCCYSDSGSHCAFWPLCIGIIRSNIARVYTQDNTTVRNFIAVYWGNRGYNCILKTVNRAYISMSGRREVRGKILHTQLRPLHLATDHNPSPQLTWHPPLPKYYLLESGRITGVVNLAGRHSDFRVYAEDYHVWYTTGSKYLQHYRHFCDDFL